MEIDVECLLARLSNGEFRLRIEDRASRVALLNIEITAEAIADLVSSRPFTAQADFSPSGNIGKRMEVKRVRFPYGTQDDWPRARAECVAALADEGWEVDTESGFNFHRSTRVSRDAGYIYELTARRWVA